MLEIFFWIQPRSGKLLHPLGRLFRYTQPNCEQLEICLDIEYLLCRNQPKIENICHSWRSIWLVTVQCSIVVCLADLNTAASVFFQNEYPDISKSAQTSTVIATHAAGCLYSLDWTTGLENHTHAKYEYRRAVFFRGVQFSR